MADIRPLSEFYEEKGIAWADAEAAASILEDTKSAYQSELIIREIEATGCAHNRAEATVKSSQEWKDYIKKCVDARHKANVLKVQCEALRMRFGEWQSVEANQRVQARL